MRLEGCQSLENDSALQQAVCVCVSVSLSLSWVCCTSVMRFVFSVWWNVPAAQENNNPSVVPAECLPHAAFQTDLNFPSLCFHSAYLCEFHEKQELAKKKAKAKLSERKESSTKLIQAKDDKYNRDKSER